MVDKNKKLILLSPPKTASNSIRVLLEHLGYVFITNPKLHCPQIHLKLSEIINLYEINNLSDYKIIQITRNPYHRFISSFFFQKKIMPTDYTPIFRNYNLEEFSKHLFSSKKTNNFIDNFYGDTSFVNYTISNGISWGGSRLYDTQSSWCDIDLDVKFFKLEELSMNTISLQEFLNENIKRLPIINSQGLTKYVDLITPEIKEIIVELFNEDFIKYGYLK